jgi:hypothetical protein
VTKGSVLLPWNTQFLSLELGFERDFVRDAGRFQAWMLRRRVIKHQSKHQKILGRREKIRKAKAQQKHQKKIRGLAS